MFLCYYVRYLEVEYINRNYFRLNILHTYNKIAMIAAAIMLIGLSFLTSFQVDRLRMIHVPAAGAFFFFGVCYYFAQVNLLLMGF